MSYDRPLPNQLPPDGYLLDELGYLEEPKAALSINLTPQTLIDYRKSGIGPDYTIVGRTILYSKVNMQKWLDAGGTRQSIESGVVADPTAKAPRRAARVNPRGIENERAPSLDKRQGARRDKPNQRIFSSG